MTDHPSHRDDPAWQRIYRAVLREYPTEADAAKAADQLYLEEKAMREGRFNIPLTNPHERSN